MPNLNLPESIVDGQTGRISDVTDLYTEINKMSRDTGSCDLTGLLANGATAGSARIRRRGYDDKTVLRFVNLKRGEGANGPTILTLGTTPETEVSAFFFNGPQNRRSPLFRTLDGTEFYFTRQGVNINLVIPDGASTGPYAIEWELESAGPWPDATPPVVNYA